jgi:hypothetical protein
MKRYAILRKDKTILVKTPVPYVVTAYVDADREKLENVRFRLNESVRFLNDCLRVLKISRKEAIAKEYTLNIATGDALSILANLKKVSYPVWKMIREYEW